MTTGRGASAKIRRKKNRTTGAGAKSNNFDNILLVFDESNYPLLKDESEFYLKFSHDINLAQFGQSVIDCGGNVYVTCGDRLLNHKLARRVESFYPVVQIEHESRILEKYNIIASCGPELLLLKEKFPESKIVAFFAAIHFIESPGLHDQTWLYKIGLALRLHVDIVVTQHQRMAEIINLLSMLTASVDFSERIICCPLGLWEPIKQLSTTKKQEIKNQLQIKDGIIIGNAGGIWRWTDYISFLNGFLVSQRLGFTNLKLFITGVTQPNNHDHEEHSRKLYEILYRNEDLTSRDISSDKPIIVIDDWLEGGRILKSIMPIMDIGLNLNTDTLEGWQSYRVRVLDYLKHNIPIINSGDDWLNEKYRNSGYINAEIGNTKSYLEILSSISSGKTNLNTIRSNQIELSKKLYYKNRYSKLYEDICRIEVRNNKSPEDLPPCMYDLARQFGKVELRKQLIEVGLEKIAHTFYSKYLS